MLMVADAANGPDVSLLTQYGVLGLFAIIMIYIIAKMYNRETKRADACADQVEKLNEFIRDKVIPALTSAAEVLKEHVDIDRDILVELRRIRGDQ